jgi:hypothetical protein
MFELKPGLSQNPAFGTAQIRRLTEIFVERSIQVLYAVLFPPNPDSPPNSFATCGAAKSNRRPQGIERTPRASTLLRGYAE